MRIVNCELFMTHATLIGTFQDDGSGEGIYRSDIEIDYQQLQFTDLIGAANIPPTLNIFLGETHLGEGVLAQLEANSKYGAGSIVSTHDTEAKVPSAEKFEAIRDKLISLGLTADQVEEAIGTSPTKTLFQTKNDLINWLKTNQ